MGGEGGLLVVICDKSEIWIYFSHFFQLKNGNLSITLKSCHASWEESNHSIGNFDWTK